MRLVRTKRDSSELFKRPILSWQPHTAFNTLRQPFQHSTRFTSLTLRPGNCQIRLASLTSKNMIGKKKKTSCHLAYGRLFVLWKLFPISDRATFITVKAVFFFRVYQQILWGFCRCPSKFVWGSTDSTLAVVGKVETDALIKASLCVNVREVYSVAEKVQSYCQHSSTNWKVRFSVLGGGLSVSVKLPAIDFGFTVCQLLLRQGNRLFLVLIPAYRWCSFCSISNYDEILLFIWGVIVMFFFERLHPNIGNNYPILLVRYSWHFRLKQWSLSLSLSLL